MEIPVPLFVAAFIDRANEEPVIFFLADDLSLKVFLNLQAFFFTGHR